MPGVASSTSSISCPSDGDSGDAVAGATADAPVSSLSSGDLSLRPGVTAGVTVGDGLIAIAVWDVWLRADTGAPGLFLPGGMPGLFPLPGVPVALLTFILNSSS